MNEQDFFQPTLKFHIRAHICLVETHGFTRATLLSMNNNFMKHKVHVVLRY